MDPDIYELSKAEFRQLTRGGRSTSASPKVQLTVRYDANIVEAFKAGGEGWQTRMNSALRDWLTTHSAQGLESYAAHGKSTWGG